MMENYFVVLQLPDIMGLEFLGSNKNTENFLSKAAQAIGSGKAKLVSRRNDTGVSEELKSFAKKENKFKTYILLTICLGKREGKSTIFKKAMQSLSGHKKAMVIDTTDNFTLVAAEA